MFILIELTFIIKYVLVTYISFENTFLYEVRTDNRFKDEDNKRS